MRESAVSEVGTEPDGVVPSVCAKACWFPDLSVSLPLVLCQARVEKKVHHKSIHVPGPETLGPVSRILWPQSRRARIPYPRSADFWPHAIRSRLRPCEHASSRIGWRVLGTRKARAVCSALRSSITLALAMARRRCPLVSRPRRENVGHR